ncbi:MAG TPA: DNA internalization-related competence protein ComEC/Rec2 [Methylococcaceae bacterium]|jgi:competence protein ComEC|nr:DNA internalization-related competence protein ComEC/Rec2 [Methylococcaceae bacterium]HIN67944.1 DNA internalization-related competence protein ComEC/Rec2 [Methylococcales bacterium]HIA44978.1 DNA internalization-related competence protein ComEC/Rec2 [Methylococcaceae bacterium]HIB61769.1 DNA internalization-related competence protein ComEC/Rec2 [Methylococcaceae bacterium]HIO12472.1 DNA internalization-related competence protein ComEC/Rec2 [Methylococcales bacterium]
MVIRIILFVLGIAFYLKGCSYNPLVGWFVYSLIVIGLFSRNRQYAFFFLGGMTWVLAWGLWQGNGELSTQLEGRDINVVGVIYGLPISDQRRVKFDLRVIRSEIGPLPEKIRLNWYSPPKVIRAGQKWLLTVRLKKPHGYANPGGFDYEQWLLTQGIGASGYVRSDPTALLIGTSDYNFSSADWRQYFHALLTKQIGHSPYYGVSEALVIGYKANVTKTQWQLFKNTGTIHLMVISGLHIGLIATIAYFMTLKGLTLIKGLQVAPPQVAAMVTIAVSSFYAALAGFTVPTQRALIMLVVMMLSIIWQRHSRPIAVLLLALLVVVMVNPYTILSSGLWLSFLAVGLIQYVVTARLKPTGYLLSTVKVHVILTIGLMPLLIAFFQQFSVLSPLANFIAVPLVTFWIVPLLLLAVMMSLVSDGLGMFVFEMVELGFDVLLGGLSILAHRDFSVVYVANSNPVAWLLAILGAMILMMPRGLSSRWLGVVLLGPILFVVPEKTERGAFKLTLLDVGQGLSAVVQTANHVLIYDAGARFSTGDMGERVIVPFLRFNNINAIDVLMVSHSDNDHLGGVQSIIEAMTVSEVITSEPQALLSLKPSLCQQGQQWQWDGVTFSILSPGGKKFKARNDNSCVLKVSSSSGTVLLPGDIELPREVFLTNRLKAALKADVLIAPHHGSNTSSSEAFLAAVSPRWVLIPAGYRNRYKLPRSEVLERYKRYRIEAFNVSDTGALTVDFKKKSLRLSAYRENKKRCY